MNTKFFSMIAVSALIGFATGPAFAEDPAVAPAPAVETHDHSAPGDGMGMGDHEMMKKCEEKMDKDDCHKMMMENKAKAKTKAKAKKK